MIAKLAVFALGVSGLLSPNSSNFTQNDHHFISSETVIDVCEDSSYRHLLCDDASLPEGYNCSDASLSHGPRYDFMTIEGDQMVIEPKTTDLNCQAMFPDHAFRSELVCERAVYSLFVNTTIDDSPFFISEKYLITVFPLNDCLSLHKEDEVLLEDLETNLAALGIALILGTICCCLCPEERETKTSEPSTDTKSKEGESDTVIVSTHQEHVV